MTSTAVPFESHLMEPGSGTAFEVRAGDRLTIAQVEGRQVADLVSFAADDLDERLSMFASRSRNANWRLRQGHTLVSTRGREMWRLDVDTVGDNYTGGGYCNPRVNLRRYGTPGDATCEGNFEAALAPYGLDRHGVDPDVCFNVFMHVGYDPDGTWAIRETTAAQGDRMVLHALMDQVVAVSNCPQLLSAVNAGGLKHLRLELSR